MSRRVELVTKSDLMSFALSSNPGKLQETVDTLNDRITKFLNSGKAMYLAGKEDGALEVIEEIEHKLSLGHELSTIMEGLRPWVKFKNKI